jgi:hypothetical protein
MTRRTPGRATRQILSGTDLAPPPDTVGGRAPGDQPIPLVFQYFVGLAVLVVVSALAWAFWGMAAASPLLFILALGLVAAWIVL